MYGQKPNTYRGHIKDARNIPLSTIDSYRVDTTKPVYLICQSGICSKKAARILSKKGYQAIHVKGGMLAWIGKNIGGKK